MTAFTLASLKKGMAPGPVYEAHFADGSTVRMSFFQQQGRPWDFTRGRSLCQWAWQQRELSYRLLFDELDRQEKRIKFGLPLREYRPCARDVLGKPYAAAPDIVAGFVEHPSVGRVADPMDVPTERKKRVTAKQATGALASLVWALESAEASGDDVAAALEKARELITA